MSDLDKMVNRVASRVISKMTDEEKKKVVEKVKEKLNGKKEEEELKDKKEEEKPKDKKEEKNDKKKEEKNDKKKEEKNDKKKEEKKDEKKSNGKGSKKAMIERICIAATKPSKSEIDKLVQAYGKYLGSQSSRAPIRTQQRLSDRFNNVLGKMIDKYPNYDLSSATFWSQMERFSRKWWDNKAFRGPGSDW